MSTFLPTYSFLRDVVNMTIDGCTVTGGSVPVDELESPDGCIVTGVSVPLEALDSPNSEEDAWVPCAHFGMVLGLDLNDGELTLRVLNSFI